MAISMMEGFPKVITLGGGLKMEVAIITEGANNDSYCSKLSKVLAATCSANSRGVSSATRLPVNIHDNSGGPNNGRFIKLTSVAYISSVFPVCVIAFGR